MAWFAMVGNRRHQSRRNVYGPTWEFNDSDWSHTLGAIYNSLPTQALSA